MNGQYMCRLFHVSEFKPSFQVRLPSGPVINYEKYVEFCHHFTEHPLSDLCLLWKRVLID